MTHFELCLSLNSNVKPNAYFMNSVIWNPKKVFKGIKERNIFITTLTHTSPNDGYYVHLRIFLGVIQILNEKNEMLLCLYFYEKKAF